MMSGDIASRFRAVSMSVSPLETLDVAAAKFSVSALRRFSAISNDMRVRVLASKNRLTTVRPRSAGTFLIARPPISFIASAVSSTSAISPGVRSAMPSRWRPDRLAGVSVACDTLNHHLVLSVDLLEPHLHALVARGRQVLADIVRFDGQLAMTAIDQHHQLNRARPAEVDERVDRRANRPARIEHVVDEDDPPIVNRKRDLGA